MAAFTISNCCICNCNITNVQGRVAQGLDHAIVRGTIGPIILHILHSKKKEIFYGNIEPFTNAVLAKSASYSSSLVNDFLNKIEPAISKS